MVLPGLGEDDGVDQDDGGGCADHVLGRQEYGRGDVGHAGQCAGAVAGPGGRYGRGQWRVGGEYGPVGACGGGVAGRREIKRMTFSYMSTGFRRRGR